MSSRIPSRVVGNYKVPHNAGSTSPYASSTKNSTDNRLPVKGVRSVKPTDKKFAYELRNYGSRPIQSNYSYVNKTAERQVPFPRSNRTSMCVGGLAGRYRNTAKQWEKTDRTLRQPWIGGNQSAASDFSPSATPPVSQLQLRQYTLSDQSETSNPGSFCYKSRCRSQFVSSVSPRTENSTVSSIGCRILQQSNTPVRHQSTARVSYLSNKPVRCSATGIHQLSNTPVQWKSTGGMNCLSYGPVRRQAVRPSQLSNTPVRRQPSSPNSTLTCLLRSLCSNCRIRRRQTRRRRFQKCNLMCALCVATRIWGLPIIGDICCRFIRWIWSGLLWCMPTTSTRDSNAALDD